MKNKTHFLINCLKGIVILGIAGTVLFFMMGGRNMEDIYIFKSNASENSAKMFFTPKDFKLFSKMQGTAKLWVDVGGTTSFIHIEITFNPNIIRLVKDVNVSNPYFNRIIKITPFNEANQTGRIILAVGGDPLKKNMSPSGILELADIVFEPIKDGQTALNFDTTKMQIVSREQKTYFILGDSATITTTINPTVSVTPIPAVSSSTKVIVYAAGTPSKGVYPNIRIGLIHENGKKKWYRFENVKGDPYKNNYQVFSIMADYPSSELKEIQVAYINNNTYSYKDSNGIKKTEYRDLKIEKVVINGIEYKKPSQVIKRANLCKEFNDPNDGWLKCNDTFIYLNNL